MTRTTHKFTDRLKPYDRTRPNAGCVAERHTRYWVGCRYCQANLNSSDGLGEREIKR